VIKKFIIDARVVRLRVGYLQSFFLVYSTVLLPPLSFYLVKVAGGAAALAGCIVVNVLLVALLCVAGLLVHIGVVADNLVCGETKKNFYDRISF
jgi:hypothetical protein